MLSLKNKRPILASNQNLKIMNDPLEEKVLASFKNPDDIFNANTYGPEEGFTESEWSRIHPVLKKLQREGILKSEKRNFYTLVKKK